MQVAQKQNLPHQTFVTIIYIYVPTPPKKKIKGSVNSLVVQEIAVLR
jgi:hypothetical protein